MGRIDQNITEALEWLRFALNPESVMPTVSDWSALYFFADKQKIIGVCNPTRYDVRIGMDTLALWIGYTLKIVSRSTLLNKRVEELCRLLEEAGFRCCILKGQGNAEMYPDPLLRMPGDIDVWVNADEQTVRKFVRDRFPEPSRLFKHFDFPLYDDVSVDIHVTPLKFYCPLNNKRLQRWIMENKKEQFEHKIHLTGIDKDIMSPTPSFNAVYQLGHMLIHLYDEGFGFRHIVDYYYVLKCLEVSEEERLYFESTLASLGMLRFAKAVMWVECEVLGLLEQYLLVTPDKKCGQQLLEDILDGGNFGKYSQRYKGKYGFYRRGLVEARRILALANFAPCEAASCLVRKVITVSKHVLFN